MMILPISGLLGNYAVENGGLLSGKRSIGDKLAFAARVLSDPNGAGAGFGNALAERKQQEQGLLAQRLQELQMQQVEQNIRRQQEFQSGVTNLLGRKGDLGANEAGPMMPGRSRGHGLLGGEINPSQFKEGLLSLQAQYDPTSFMDSMLNPKSENIPDKIQQINSLIGMGLSPNEAMSMVYAPPNQTNVNINDKLRSIPDQFLLDSFNDQSSTIRDSAKTATASMQNARQGINLLKNVNTGAWEGIKGDAAKWLGVAPEMVGNQQIFQSLAGDAVLQGLANFKGATSEKELDFIKTIKPSLGKDQFANYALYKVQERAAMRAQDQARKFRDYIRTPQGQADPYGFEDWYFANHDSIPEFDVNELRMSYEMEILGKSKKQVTAKQGAKDNGYIQ